MPEESGRLTITAERGGTITEVTQFLSDLENAYLALYAFDQRWPPSRVWRRFHHEMWLELGYPFLPLVPLGQGPVVADAIPPSARLVLERVRIESPGFWEFVASLNPLQRMCLASHGTAAPSKTGAQKSPLERTYVIDITFGPCYVWVYRDHGHRVS